MVSIPIQCLNHGIGKRLPSPALMASGCMGTHRERGIQQQHPLFGPSSEVSRSRDRPSQILFYLPENILQRRWKRHAVVHREAESVSLPILMIRVLTNNDHLHLIKRTQIKSIENQSTRRETCSLRIFLPYKISQIREIRLLKFSTDMRLPRLFYLYIHHISFAHKVTKKICCTNKESLSLPIKKKTMDKSLELQQSILRDVTSLFGNTDALKKLHKYLNKLKKEETSKMSKAEKEEILDDIRDGLREAKMAREKKITLQSAQDFLNEIRY